MAGGDAEQPLRGEPLRAGASGAGVASDRRPVKREALLEAAFAAGEAEGVGGLVAVFRQLIKAEAH